MRISRRFINITINVVNLLEIENMLYSAFLQKEGKP